MKITRIGIIANTIIRPGMSGGTRILIECAKAWLDRGIVIYVFTSDVGEKLCRDNGLNGAKYVTWASSKYKGVSAIVLFLIGTVKGCLIAMKNSQQMNKTIIYSNSDFWPDSVPGFIAKLRNKNSQWIAALYLFAPSPLSKESPYRGRKFLRGLLYWLSQIPTYQLIKKYADMVWVTNELDRWMFIDGKRLTSDRVIAVRGGVDTKTPASIPEPKEKRFDAVFIGRFHPQKGVLELMDIWKYVVERKKDAKLAIIGVGDLEREVREKIKKYGSEDNITLFGFKDGVEKLKIFKDSKVVVHPAIYDSGGMAACEAMACDLPGVSFDLPALRSYYPKGMLKTPCFDLKAFAENILKLLNDEKLYKKTSKDALDWAEKWDWDKRAEELLETIKRAWGIS